MEQIENSRATSEKHPSGGKNQEETNETDESPIGTDEINPKAVINGQDNKAPENAGYHGPESGRESQERYGQAFVQARKEFEARGIDHPTGKTPGFLDRIQDIYRNLMREKPKKI